MMLWDVEDGFFIIALWELQYWGAFQVHYLNL